jgi:TonB family protein
MKKFFLIFFLGYSYLGFSQFNKKYQKGDTLHYNRWYEITTKEKAMRYGVVTDVVIEEKQDLYAMEFYKLDTASQTFVKEEVLFSKSPKWIRREGKNTTFWENGQKKGSGNRKSGDKIGLWQEWYEDGTKMAEYEYFEPEDTPKSKKKGYHLVNFWNRKGELIVKDGTGNYSFIDKDGEKVEGEMVNYNKEGLWQGFRVDGSKKYKEIYKEGEFVQGESWDEEGNRYTYITIFEKGEYSDGREGLVKLISENFKVPQYATERGIEGRVYVYFEVNKEGKVENIEVSRSLCEPCDQEAVRVVKMFKDWKPGKHRGQNSRVKYNLPFRIKLTSR